PANPSELAAPAANVAAELHAQRLASELGVHDFELGGKDGAVDQARVVGIDVDNKTGSNWRLHADHGAARVEHNRLSDLAEMAADTKRQSDDAKKQYFEASKAARGGDTKLGQILDKALTTTSTS